MSQSSLDRIRGKRRVGGERRAGDATQITEALRERGRVALRVHGTSMLPWVRPGDIGIIRKASREDVRRGDLVLFQRNDRLFVHRIVDERQDLSGRQVSTKGDAHPTTDGWLNEEELLGRVIRIYRNGKRIHMETATQLALGRVIAQLSLWSRFWYPAARFAVVTSRPMRRQVSHWLASTEAIR